MDEIVVSAKGKDTEIISGITTANCPYCNIKLDKFPIKKIKCKNCGNEIYVRTRPSDRKKILIKKDEIILIEKEWENLYNDRKQKSIANLKPLEIYSTKKPEIINFVNNEDYKLLLVQYQKHAYSKIDLNKIFPIYPYNKYDWNILLQIVWKYQNYCYDIKQMKNNGIKKVKLLCHEKCYCCKNILDTEIQLNKAPELPIKNCPLESRICIGAIYSIVLSYDD